jgi:aminoglycoside/choline kinase family phosphotransferase
MNVSEVSTHIPMGPDQLTDDWLTGALRRGGALKAASVTSHGWASLERQGAAGVVGRVTLQYDSVEPDAPVTVVAKFASPYEPTRRLLHGHGGYRKEVEFYRWLGHDAGIPVPRCFYGDIDLASGFFVLLLEDMGVCRAGDPLEPSVADAEVAIRHLAPFHARWWDSPRLRTLEWLPHPGSPEVSAHMAEIQASLGDALATVRQRFGARFPSTCAAVGQRLVANWERLARTRGTSRLTLVHRDFHTGQMLFPSEEGGRFVVFDWQTLAVGQGADDLARIIVMGLSVTQRERHDRRLIKLYHSILLSHGVADYDLELCVLDFRFGLTTSLIVNMIGAASIDPDLIGRMETELGIDIADTLFGRLAAAFEAHDVLALLPAS